MADTNLKTTIEWDRADRTPLSEFAQGFDEYKPATSQSLDGRRFVLHCTEADGGKNAFTLTQRFEDGRVEWEMSSSDGASSGEASYEAFEMQPGLFFIHYATSSDPAHPTVLSTTLDLEARRALVSIGELGVGEQPHLSRQYWYQGALDGSQPDPIEHTDELIGHRIRYAYSPRDVYDHIYLNRSLFTWICLSTGDTSVDSLTAGAGDTDSSIYWKVRPNTYLFGWVEKLVGVDGLVLIDLNQNRTVGIQFGLDQTDGSLVNMTMGAYAQDAGKVGWLDEFLPGPPARS